MKTSQNRADERRQVIADQQVQTVVAEEQQNETLLRLCKEMLGHAEEIHAASSGHTGELAIEAGPRNRLNTQARVCDPLKEVPRHVSAPDQSPVEAGTGLR